MSEEEILRAREAGIPHNTNKDTKYCVSVWEAWKKERQESCGMVIPQLKDMTTAQLSKWMTHFVLEARKKDGTVYPPNSLHHLVAGLMRYLRNSGRAIDVFRDAQFSDFRASLDAEMKRLQSAGVGSQKRQAEVITRQEEDRMWEKGLLGDTTPQSLLDSMVFYNGLCFALRSGKEHRQLRNIPCQIQLVERPGEKPYLQYTEDISKNHQGGLRGRNIRPKVVLHHANTEHPDRCFVRMFPRYRSLCPSVAPPHAFYLQPSRCPTSSCWYSNIPSGHTTLGKTVSRLCKEAGIEGFHTNHSLRATTTSRFYQAGVDEQLVMERTGHRSAEGVRSYKRSSDTQRQVLSDIVNGTVTPPTPPTQNQLPGMATCTAVQSKSQVLQGLSLPSATFKNCSVNFYLHPHDVSAATSTRTPSKRRRAVISDSDSD